MTGMVGILLALVAGMTVSSRRGVLVVVALPFLLVCAVQTWLLAAGLGVNPSSTVTQFPGNLNYVAVQATILVLALVAADQVRLARWGHGRRRFASARARTDRRDVVRGLVINLVVSVAAVTVAGVVTISSVRQSGDGIPPIYGVVGIALLPAVIVVLGIVNLTRAIRGRGRTGMVRLATTGEDGAGGSGGAR
jgi:hypothetical protein